MTKRKDSRFDGSLRTVAAAGLLACGTLISSTAHASLVFQFDFSADPGAPAFTAQQQAAIVTGGNLFSQMFATHFTNSATLQFNVVSQITGLAAATDDTQLNANGTAGETVLTKVTTGVDLNGAAADGSIFINLATDFQYDPNAPVDFEHGQIDLFSVLDHELTHAFGFSSDIQTGDPVFHNKFDTFLTTNSGVPIVDPITESPITSPMPTLISTTACSMGPRQSRTMVRWPRSKGGVAIPWTSVAASAISVPLNSRHR